MDIAYDHIQEEVLSPDEQAQTDSKQEQINLNQELQDAYKAFSSSPWAAKLGGFFGSVKKQGESYLEEVRQEYTAASAQATRGLSDVGSSLLSRTRGLSVNHDHLPSDASESSPQAGAAANEPTGAEKSEKPESLPADIVKEAESMLSRFRLEAAKRLKEIEKAEDAADEALLRFGTNIRNFLRDAVTVVPPASSSEEGDSRGNSGGVMFESKDSEGKRVIHTTRFDAQLHAIHSREESFTGDPEDGGSAEWDKWRASFDVEGRTGDIARDFERYEELRWMMERLVPERVEYEVFWRRYYFLRQVLEAEEQRRKELLKGAATAPAEEEISWDAESSSDDESSTPNAGSTDTAKLSTSTATIQPSSAAHSQTPSQAPSQASASAPSNVLAAPAQPRRSNDQQSQADSDASYDVVSGATSRAPGSPKEEKRKEGEVEKKSGGEGSDEEDWE